MKVLIGIGGGIAAYKVCEIISSLFKTGIELKVILTAGGEQFITPLTVATLSRHPAYTDRDFWQPLHHRPLHIELGEWADLLVIAPLTANTLGKLAQGLADNLLTNTVLASTCPILLAPAMNTEMWNQVAVQRNWQLLGQDPRYHVAGAGVGLLACDRVGMGRMAEPEEILPYIHSLLHTGGKRDLTGKRVLVSTGGTREFFDPVRFIGNPATGKMGLALAQAAAHRGGIVTLVHSTLPDVAIDRRIQLIQAIDSAMMQQQMVAHFATADLVLMSAAVADVKPAHYSDQKLPKKLLPTNLELAPVPDIIAELSKLKQPHQKLIGFAAQTGDIITPALEKLQRKNLDAIVTNPVDLPDSGFGSDRNQAVMLKRSGDRLDISPCAKLEMAHQILDGIF
ncbi:bifunctional phosphopantothenoylcysteine decarboxylase/phosphopantothenate--cysteine ligase CoaBC [Chamaesiphon minutus]|uniref:Coenzyme A biosynthesis bifunctional protein CoaBC n=1 Tax=Chamaesiphon minutus (strain ATCC 27169 / PCC 6605) TaxID=1173020 RepID=K9UMA2_CHAP6|nr:bifunctional phosphopantothenoylcysteine decarboxylase/phosphopantothenate--cysteine ligase CoaBC [Chamaesiphon minutus]AFY95763.1 phosphopantothenoylcysteine decarboxylase/phosphopantothenate--cysteine ligase [Chamaesiphon minutus PCC 6605]